MTFRDSYKRLLDQIRKRLQNGEFTERSLARRLGISQSHINNVLRGRRKLSPEVADLILNSFHGSVLDLHPLGELESYLNRRCLPQLRQEIPVLKRAIGPGRSWSYLLEVYYGVFPFAVSTAEASAVLARIEPDPRMQSALSDADIALLDTSISSLTTDCPSCLYVVSYGQNTLIRWIRGGTNKLYLLDERTFNRPMEWASLPMTEEQRIAIVKGKIVWLGTEAVLRWI